MVNNTMFRTAAANVFLVDPNPAERRHHQALLSDAGLSVQTFDSGNAFLNAWHPTLRGCLVTELRLPDMTAIEMTTQITHRGYALPPWIVLTSSNDMLGAVQAVKQGAFDLLPKPADSKQFMSIVHEAMRTDAETEARHLQLQQARRAMDSLSPREKQVLEQLVQGVANKTVAAQLGLSQKTVASHRARILQKLNAQSLVDLFRITQLLNHKSPAAADSQNSQVMPQA